MAKVRTVLGVAAAALIIGRALTAFGADPNDRAAADAALREVESSPRKDVGAEMIGRSRAGLDRGAKLRASGDETHAKLAEGVARTWAEAARDLVKAVEVEQRAQAARLAATDAGTIADRERALLEEGIAQRGRAKAQLESMERDTKQPARTSAAANLPDTSPKKSAPAIRDAGAP